MKKKLAKNKIEIVDELRINRTPYRVLQNGKHFEVQYFLFGWSHLMDEITKQPRHFATLSNAKEVAINHAHST